MRLYNAEPGGGDPPKSDPDQEAVERPAHFASASAWKWMCSSTKLAMKKYEWS